jgi:hypothetical protein
MPRIRRRAPHPVVDNGDGDPAALLIADPCQVAGEAEEADASEQHAECADCRMIDPHPWRQCCILNGQTLLRVGQTSHWPLQTCALLIISV